MTDFLLIVLAVTQIPIIFIFTSRKGVRLASDACLRKNPDWLASHPQFKLHNKISAVALGYTYLVAVGSVLAILNYAFLTPKADYLALLLVIPLTLWMVGYLVYFVFFQVAVIQRIPAPKIRKASLVDRRLTAFLPSWAVYLCYGFLSLIVMIYCWALLGETLDGELAITRIIGFSAVIALGSSVLLVALRRKYSDMEYVIGANGRKIEVLASMSVLYLVLCVGVYLLIEDFFALSFFTAAGFLVLVSLLVQLYFLAFFLRPTFKMPSLESL